ncbi:MAG: hypothetical protein GX308_03335 [Epulopiscium sp.]|nr:hypothetical protein [Candidatus Epulonipiscium sp.]
MEQELGGGLKALLIIASLLFPIVGIIVGIIWMTDKNGSEEKRRFGKTLLIIGIAVPVVICICYISVFVIAGLASF